MTKFIRVHFDGKVLVPEEPVDLPIGQSLSMRVEQGYGDADALAATNAADPEPTPTSLADFAKWIDEQPAPDGWESPTDGAAQHDHYLYGSPKRDQP